MAGGENERGDSSMRIQRSSAVPWLSHTPALILRFCPGGEGVVPYPLSVGTDSEDPRFDNDFQLKGH